VPVACRTHHPSIVPQTNTGNQGYETLYQDRQPTFVPEEYAIDGNTNADTRQTDVDAELALFESNQYIAQRYRLLPWPLFALGDGGGVHTLASPSLVRVQVYSALAYGMKGLYYYCWGEGIWNVTTQFYGPGNPTPNYNVVKVRRQRRHSDHPSAAAVNWTTTHPQRNTLRALTRAAS
jgi:hypothetical protein